MTWPSERTDVDGWVSSAVRCVLTTISWEPGSALGARRVRVVLRVREKTDGVVLDGPSEW